VHSQSYTYDLLGNPLSRNGANTTCDALNRLLPVGLRQIGTAGNLALHRAPKSVI
jgi:hypothetical protein